MYHGRIVEIGGTMLLVVGVPVLCLIAGFTIKRGVPRYRVALWAVLGVYVLAALSLLFFPVRIGELRESSSEYWGYAHGFGINVVPFKTILEFLTSSSLAGAATQILGNVGLLFPLGLLLPALMPRFRKVSMLLLLVLAITIGIEAVQYFGTVAGFIRRSVDIDDVMLNVVGALLGWAAWKRASTALARRGLVRQVANASEFPV